jgi:tetratricopeptide (TPR) repeat protein
MERFILILLSLAAVLLSGGCAVSEPHLSVFQGNQDYIKGEFQEANIHYLKALKYREDKFEKWIRYNIGNVYFALGERASAEDQWIEAADSANGKLRFSALFNLGVYFYEEGEYDKAYHRFREALEIDPAQLDAKRNLELALDKLESREQMKRGEEESEQEEQAGGEIEYTQRILEFVKRKEEQLWFVPSETAEDGPAEDW